MRRPLSTGAVLIAAAGSLTFSHAGPATSAPPSGASASALERSDALAAVAAPHRFSAGVHVPAEAARGFAAGLADDVPLPQGGTFDGVQWEAAGGEFSAGETRAVLQYNAMCQWVRAHRDGRETDVTGRILADVPSWPAWRDTETATVLGEAIAQLLAGGGSASAALLAECDAAHAREVRYAEARGLDASR